MSRSIKLQLVGQFGEGSPPSPPAERICSYNLALTELFYRSRLEGLLGPSVDLTLNLRLPARSFMNDPRYTRRNIASTIERHIIKKSRNVLTPPKERETEREISPGAPAGLLIFLLLAGGGNKSGCGGISFEIKYNIGGRGWRQKTRAGERVLFIADR